MSDYTNQYDSPYAPVVPEKMQSSGSLTETMLRYLKEASPWLRFVGIMGFIHCGFIAIGVIITIVASIIASDFLGEFGSFPIWLLSPFYIALGVLLFFPSLFTYNMGERIQKYQFSNSNEDLEQAFKNNKSFWKFYGIMYIIYLSIIPVMIIISIVFMVAAAANFL
ncbi:MAG: DUF5362 family protein [Treponema sp.]|nr:DUF5362 family protein [Treponema sp.]